MTIDDLVYQYRRLAYRAKPVPRIRVPLPGTLPAWLVRVAAALCTAGAVVLAGYQGLTWSVLLALTGVLALWIMVRPGYQAGLTTAGLAGVLVVTMPAPTPPVALVIASAAYLGFRFTLVAGLLSWWGRAHWSALLGWRDAVILAATAVLATTTTLPTTWWTPILGAAGLIAVALVWRRTR